MPVTLLTTKDDFETLHDLVDGLKRTVKIDRDVLGRLLVDHTKLINMCRTHALKVIEPEPPTPKRVRTKLMA